MGLPMELFGLLLDLQAAERRVLKYAAEIDRLRAENAELREHLKLAASINLPSPAEIERERLQWILDEGGFGGA